MAHGDGPDDLYDDSWDAYDDGWGDEPVEPEGAGDGGGGDGGDAVDAGDDGGWGDDPPARAAALRLLVGVAVLLFGIGLIVALSKASDDDDDDDSDEVATQESSTSSSRRTTTTDLALPGDGGSTVTTGRSGSTSSTVRGTSTTRRSTTTTTAPDGLPEPVCASGGGGPATPVSDDWATRWQTKPLPNDPAKVTICVDDATPKVGQVVHLSLRGDDPDAVIPNKQCSWFVTWEGAHANPCQDVTVPTGDPRPTPLEAPGHVVVQLEHVYGTPGAKTIIGSVASTEGELGPYTSYAESDLVITVHE